MFVNDTKYREYYKREKMVMYVLTPA